jgi:N-acetyl sugar amidotransferase
VEVDEVTSINKVSKNYRICTTTVMDTTVPGITFDEQGESNFCGYYRELASRTVLRPAAVLKTEFDKAMATIKEAGKGKTYDCILGVSGGLDSTYLALLAKRNGLRPLLVHFDNGWNSELAIKNIENIVNRLGFGLHTFVMDWEEFRDIQRAYFKASVVDVEVPTDQFIFAALHRIAYQNGIRFILAGNNVVSESINPEGWVYKNKLDLVNLKAIHKKYGALRLKNLPRLGLYERYFYEAIKGIQTVNFLDLIPYEKDKVTEEIQRELDWKDYGGKHYESVFTRFYQGYYLPVKFNIDKRRAHWSNLILSGQATREQAIRALENPTYSPKDQLADRDYTIKKLGLTLNEWKEIMEAPPVRHESFATDQAPRYQFFFLIFRAVLFLPVRILRTLHILPSIEKIGSSW